MQSIDLDGKVGHSQVILLRRSDNLAAATFSVFPIPADNSVSLKYEGKIHSDITYSVHDFSGRLISTDVLSRGIDIQQISLVINYDIPYKVEQYIHRIGRSGRFGRKGVSINLVTPSDAFKLKKIEEYYNTIVEPLPVDYSNYLD